MECPKGKENRIPSYIHTSQPEQPHSPHGKLRASDYVGQFSPIKKSTPRKSVKAHCLFCSSDKELRRIHGQYGKSKETSTMIQHYFGIHVDEGIVCRGCERKLRKVDDTIKGMAANLNKQTFKRGATSPSHQCTVPSCLLSVKRGATSPSHQCTVPSCLLSVKRGATSPTQSSVYCSILPSIGEHKLTTCDNDNDNDITHSSTNDTDSLPSSISKLSDSDNASGPSDHTYFSEEKSRKPSLVSSQVNKIQVTSQDHLYASHMTFNKQLFDLQSSDMLSNMSDDIMKLFVSREEEVFSQHEKSLIISCVTCLLNTSCKCCLIYQY